MTTTKTAKRGRPSVFTTELADRICDALADGESLRKICRKSGFPDRTTVMRWLDANSEFAAKYARAREMQADHMDDLILETANNVTERNAKAAKVKIGAYQWRAEKLKPKVYGNRTHLEHTGKDGGPIESTHELGSSIAFALRRASKASK